MNKRKRRIRWETITLKDLEKLQNEVYAFLKKRCVEDCDGDLPVAFMLRSRKHHYPFNDCLLMSQADEDIDKAIDHAMCNMSCAMGRLDTLYKLKRLDERRIQNP